MTETKKPRIFGMSFARVYPEYINKAERKGRTKDEVDELIFWLTGYDEVSLQAQLEKGTDCEHFILEMPAPNPDRSLIKGVICGYRVEEIEDPIMRELRYMDKIIDELAKGKTMEKIKRTA